ncbi:histone-like nucleoid-structuring protein Lsr2 [Enemella sp. A6]|uniref:histone-like nucleoid-structuring protein Lsr2 n=1 Tax=Enemella sp. A6 TaxID=3440152 RepID=UPI003EC0EAD7
MVKRIHVSLEDDIDGSVAEETITFALDNTTYEIDLSADNAAKLRDALALYIGHARKVSARTPRKSSAPAASSASGASAAEIRAWAIEAGHELSPRGRVPKEIREAYAAAHP